MRAFNRGSRPSIGDFVGGRGKARRRLLRHVCRKNRRRHRLPMWHTVQSHRVSLPFSRPLTPIAHGMEFALGGLPEFHAGVARKRPRVSQSLLATVLARTTCFLGIFISRSPNCEDTLMPRDEKFPTDSQPSGQSRPSSGDADRPLIIQSEDLLQGRDEVWIEHGEEMYRLRVTSSGKLYLTK